MVPLTKRTVLESDPLSVNPSPGTDRQAVAQLLNFFLLQFLSVQWGYWYNSSLNLFYMCDIKGISMCKAFKSVPSKSLTLIFYYSSEMMKFRFLLPSPFGKIQTHMLILIKYWGVGKSVFPNARRKWINDQDQKPTKQSQQSVFLLLLVVVCLFYFCFCFHQGLVTFLGSF